MGIQTTLSQMMQRAAFFMRTGLLYDGKRDLYQVFGYNRNPDHRDYVAKYLRQDIAKRIIDSPAEATWTDPPRVTGGEEFDKVWKTITEEHEIFHHLAKMDIFAGLGTYALLVIGIDDGRTLDQPVNSSRSNKIIYLQPYLEGSVKVLKYDEDSSSPRFGQPELYEVTPGELDSGNHTMQAKLILRKKFNVHWTRALHIADNTLENRTFGHSRMEPVYNLLDDLLKVVGGSAETYWMVANRGMQVDVDKEMELDSKDADELSAEIEEYQHELRRFIRTRGVKINPLGSDMADPRGVFYVLLSLLSSTTRIPQRVLMGSEAGQLASQQDRANWAEAVADRIEHFASPVILKPFIKKLVTLNILPAPTELKIEWPDAYKMSPYERAQTAAQMARSMTNAVKALATARSEVGTNVFSIEEVRSVVAFGKHPPVFENVPLKGTFPPPAEPEDPEGTEDSTPPTTSSPRKSAGDGI